jgi:hypothetical protein
VQEPQDRGPRFDSMLDISEEFVCGIEGIDGETTPSEIDLSSVRSNRLVNTYYSSKMNSSSIVVCNVFAMS